MTIVSKLNLVQADISIGELMPERLLTRQWPAVKIANESPRTRQFGVAGLSRADATAWFDLLSKDLSALPQLRPAAVALLEELPGCSTGLGATEMRMLELIAEGNASPPDVFPGHEKRNTRRVFDYWQIGALLDGLARCAVARWCRA